jgi:2-oxoglutarate dehydrogenase E1 component
LKLGGVTREEADGIAAHRREALETELSESQSGKPMPNEQLKGIWSKFNGGPEPSDESVTGVPQSQLAKIFAAQTRLPESFHPHPKIKKILQTREQMAAGKEALDWAAAESLALGSLAMAGLRIRLSGQDSERGTFSHRHAVLHDYEDGTAYTPLQHLDSNQAPVEIINSPLSETGVLGFEYGYSLDYPDGLIVWEAQYGDFWNVAQPIVDQFIASAEDKWQRLSGLVLLLPHGLEGQGPEHSSARIERFLALAAEDNMQLVYPTTPAQYFHALRRSALRPWRKPLVLFTPKGLLRHPRAVSSLEECSQGRFQKIIEDAPSVAASGVKRILLCTGKLYYELEAYRAEQKRSDTAIIRLEQLYPLSIDLLDAALRSYPQPAPIIWVQEEPANMGAWTFLRVTLGEMIGCRPLSLVSRPRAATPATGSNRRHKAEQAELIARAFAAG